MVYIDLEQVIYGGSRDDESAVKVAIDLAETCQLLEVGFEYIGNMHDHSFSEKRK